jgi:hypothetical protein
MGNAPALLLNNLQNNLKDASAHKDITTRLFNTTLEKIEGQLNQFNLKVEKDLNDTPSIKVIKVVSKDKYFTVAARSEIGTQFAEVIDSLLGAKGLVNTIIDTASGKAEPKMIVSELGETIKTVVQSALSIVFGRSSRAHEESEKSWMCYRGGLLQVDLFIVRDALVDTAIATTEMDAYGFFYRATLLSAADSDPELTFYNMAQSGVDIESVKAQVIKLADLIRTLRLMKSAENMPLTAGLNDIALSSKLEAALSPVEAQPNMFGVPSNRFRSQPIPLSTECRIRSN